MPTASRAAVSVFAGSDRRCLRPTLLPLFGNGPDCYMNIPIIHARVRRRGLAPSSVEHASAPDTRTAAGAALEPQTPVSVRMARAVCARAKRMPAILIARHSSLSAPCVIPEHYSAASIWLLSSANFAAIVGFPRVNFLIVTSWALSFARRRLRSAPINASLVFCR
jgi:hypothetical protein